MNAETDHQLIAKSLQGHTKAFGVLVERYQDFVFTIIVRMVKVHEEAEEIAQDSFIKAFERLESFKGKSKFSSWLYSIAYRSALDHLRKQRKIQNNVSIEEAEPCDFESIENGLQTMIDNERAAIIQRCIMKLPESNAAIITFYYFEELSVKEISEITGDSIDNVKIKLYRSRKQLYGFLQPFVQNEIENHGKAI